MLWKKYKYGEWVRIKTAHSEYIRKFIKRGMDYHILLDKAFEGFNYLTSVEEKEIIVKHSKNIIDLIEVGDYVNGYKVLAVGAHTPSGDWVDTDCNKQSEECTIWKEDIKTIITKEQVASIEYKI